MVVAGSGGHAKELIGIFNELKFNEDIYFFDDVNAKQNLPFMNKHVILTSLEDVKKVFLSDPSFIIGVGKPQHRNQLASKFTTIGGVLKSLISPFAHIGSTKVVLGEGLNIMTGVVITEDVKIGTGTLIHIYASVHHDAQIGEYCELSPGCRILGGAKIGSFVSIGAGAIILPNVSIGDGAVVGAGAVVIKDVIENTTVVGVPAKKTIPR